MSNTFTLRRPPSALFYSRFPWCLATDYVSMKNINVKVLCNQSRVGISQNVMSVNAFLTIRHLFLPTFSFVFLRKFSKKKKREREKFRSYITHCHESTLKVNRYPTWSFLLLIFMLLLLVALALHCSAQALRPGAQASLVAALRLQSTWAPYLHLTGFSCPKVGGILIPQPGIEPESL